MQVNLYENIFLEYARQMQKLGFHKAVGYYCSKAGGRGRKLLEELSCAVKDKDIEKTNTEKSNGHEEKDDSKE